MKKNIIPLRNKKNLFKAAVFSMTSTSVVTAKSLTAHLSIFQEKLLYVAISFLFFLIVCHKICSRVSYAICTQQAREVKEE
jgi:multidrug transporter EmrE-like cation transporter